MSSNRTIVESNHCGIETSRFLRTIVELKRFLRFQTSNRTIVELKQSYDLTIIIQRCASNRTIVELKRNRDRRLLTVEFCFPSNRTIVELKRDKDA